jgi:hypothetical protein
VPAGTEPPPAPAPLSPEAPPTGVWIEPLGRGVGATVCVPPEAGPTPGEPDVSTDREPFAEPPERTVTTVDDVLTLGVDTEPTGAFAVTLGALVEPAGGGVAFTVTVGAFGDGAGAFTTTEGLFTVTVGIVTLTAGAFTETGGTFADTVGVVTVAPVFVVDADGVVTEMLGTLTVPTGVLTGIVGVLTLTEGRLSEEAVGTCASATTSAEATHTERAFLRDFIKRAIHNS